MIASIISWNCRGFRSHTADIKDIVSTFHPACVALQETFLKSHAPAKIRGFSCFRKDVTDTAVSGGVCILASNSYPSTALNLKTSLQAVAIRIHIKSLITVCCVYLPPRDAISQKDLSNLVDQLPVPFILIGDLNGHSTLWGSADTNARGQQIEQLLSDYCLCLLNNDAVTHFHTPTKTFHALDIAICSPVLMPHLNFAVSNDLHNSDHFPVILSFTSVSNISTRPETFQYYKADWHTFAELASITEELVVKSDIDEAVLTVTATIMEAADRTIPKNFHRPRKLRHPWWNEACTKAYREQKKLWGVFRRYPSTDNLLAFKRAKAVARRTRRQSQRESWIRYTSSLTVRTPPKCVWRKVKAANGLYQEFSLPVLTANSTIYSAPEDTVDVIGKTFASVSDPSTYSPAFQERKRRAEQTSINLRSRKHFPYNCDFRMYELRRALREVHISSPGPDGISYQMLRNLAPESLHYILALFNRIWRENVYPRMWQEAIVIPILKPGKDSKDPLSYRPIALTSCLCKTMERMVNARLVYYLETNRCIPEHQSGFRRGRSTMDNILNLENDIRTAFVRRNHLVSIFFDIEKAYDRTWRYGIVRALHDFGLRGNLPLFIYNFLQQRSFRVRLGTTLSKPFIQAEGVPQGSVLSVTLFISYISKILTVLPTSVNGTLYVDDLQISCQGSDMRLIERQLQTAVKHVADWCDKHGYSISPTKSHCVHFCRKRGLHLDPDIRLGDVAIPVVKEIRYLGVIFDKKLTFLPHILHLRKNCERTLNILKVLSNTSWGADRTSLLRIYQSVILSRMDYGSVAYGSASKSALKWLDPVHHAALRICCGAFRTSPVHSLYIICNQPPLNLRRIKLSMNYYFRCLSFPNHPIKTLSLNPSLKRLFNARPSCTLPFCARIQSLLEDADFSATPIEISDCYAVPPWDIPKIRCCDDLALFSKGSTDPNIYKQIYAAHRNQFSDYYPIFTDGSKVTEQVGCGIVFGDNTFSYRLPPVLSVYTAEVVAILRALYLAKSSHQRKFCVYTDSMSALLQLKYKNNPHPVITKILVLLRNLSQKGFDVIFCWVPGHVGISGNELADCAAKAANDPIMQAIPYDDIKKSVIRYIYCLWQNYWDLQIGNKLHSIKSDIRPWQSVPHRRADVILSRLRIGHTRLTHSHILTREPIPMCLNCKKILTVYHILIECPDFNYHRKLFFQNTVLNLHDLVGENPHSNIFAFLRSTRFLNSI